MLGDATPDFPSLVPSFIHSKKDKMNKIKEIEREISKGRLQTALNLLLELVEEHFSDHDELRTSVIRLMARYNELKRRKIGGTIPEGEAIITENQIRFGTLDFVEMVIDELKYKGLGNIVQDVDLEEDMAAAPKHKILFFAAEPIGVSRLQLGREKEKIKKVLEAANLSDRFELHSSEAATTVEFMREILRKEPTIVHFSGHGIEDGIIMEDDQGHPVVVSKEKLGDVFKLFREVVGCVILNACFSAEQSDAIKKYISYVVGTSKEIPNDAAMDFSSLFYTALGEGREIDFAFEFAKSGVGLKDPAGDLFHMI